jgi:hypothetical protein
MNLTKTWPVGLLILGGTLWVIPARAETDAWQDVWQERRAAPVANTSLNWEQRALKRSQAQVETREETPRPTAQHWVSPQRVARRQTVDQDSMELIPTPNESGAPVQHRMIGADSGEAIRRGPTQYEAVPPGSVHSENPTVRHAGSAPCGPSGEFASPFDACGPCAEPCGPCEEPCDLGWEVFDGCCGPFLRGLSIIAGVDGFRGPLDRSGINRTKNNNGNFGLNEGVNLARPLGDPWGCGYQVGANFVQSDFSGDSNSATPYHRQYFATAGVFRRTECCGFQWGVAYDYMHDAYYQKSDLQQIRSETGYVLDQTYEIGYYGAYGVSLDQETATIGLTPSSMFTLFIRRNFENGGDGRIWGGATGRGGGLLGIDLWFPLGKSFAIENRATYLIPKGSGTTARDQESWGLVMQIVWYPGQNAKCQQQNPYRAMFNVADNTLFMVDRLVP